MKGKLDFVTNSSSTSFSVWGVDLTYEQTKLLEIDHDKLYDKGIEYGEGGEGYVYGIRPDKMKPTQTLEEFKREIAEILSECGIDVVSDNIEFISTEVLS